MMKDKSIRYNETIELLKKFGLTESDMGGVSETMLCTFLLLIQAAESFNNTNKTLLFNSCGEITAGDGTEYQVQMMLVPNKESWCNSEGVYYSTPISEDVN